MKYLKNPCNIYFFLWCIYFLQGTLYAAGSALSQIILIVLLIMSFLHVLKVRYTQVTYFKGYYPLLLMFTFYGLWLFVTDGVRTQGLYSHPQSFIYIKLLYISLLPICSFFYYTRKGLLNQKIFSFWVVVLILVSIGDYFRLRREALEMMMSNQEDIINNVGNSFASLIPCLLVFKKKLFQYIGLAICFLFTMFAMKRGAILIAVVSICIYFFYNMKKMKGYRKIAFITTFGLLSLVLISYLQTTLFENDFFNERLSKTKEGDSSNRDVLYASFIDFYTNDATFLEQLVGKGANGTLKVSTNYAHNDWIEILINQGLLGIIVFLIYWGRFYVTVKEKDRLKQSRIILIMVLTITFLRTIFSMSIGDNPICLCAILGFALADGSRNCDIEIKKQF